MITYVKNPDLTPTIKDTEQNRFETIRKAAADQHRKADTDGARRRARRTVEDNRPR